MQHTKIAIIAAKRSAVGNFNGSLTKLPAHKISEHVINALLAETKISANDISEVIMGQVLGAAQGQNPARQASIAAGIPKEVPALTINQVCGSGLRSVMLGCQAIMTGSANIIIAGGHESMSSAPHSMHLRAGVKMGSAEMIDTMMLDGLTDAFSRQAMGITAENIVNQFNISREAQDAFAVHSQNKAEAASKAGRFKDEIVPIKVMQGKEEVEFTQDEFIRHGVTIDALAKLRPAFKNDGSVTAGNSSGINDGAAAVILMPLEEAQKRNLKPLAIVKSFATSGVDPAIMGTGPIPASRKALSLAGWNVNDLDLIEANEAFAAQAICVNQEMGWDVQKVNVNGGAIAIGHPIGASGARVLVTLLHELQKRQAKRGLATLCIGGGMGVALCVERI
jgi:acetyl-CoA C-acetyltransferase